MRHKIVKGFKHIWNVPRIWYFRFRQLSFGLSFVFIVTALVTVILMLTVGRLLWLPPVIDMWYIRYLVIPGLTAYYMDKRTLQDKRPYSFLFCVFLFALRSKLTYNGERIVLEKKRKSYGLVSICEL